MQPDIVKPAATKVTLSTPHPHPLRYLCPRAPWLLCAFASKALALGLREWFVYRTEPLKLSISVWKCESPVPLSSRDKLRGAIYMLEHVCRTGLRRQPRLTSHAGFLPSPALLPTPFLALLAAFPY